MDCTDVVVVGAGVVGLAVARALAQTGREVLVLEAETEPGTGISSRSSEVIHAGLHGETDSLKVRLCLRGRELLYAYCAQRQVGHRRCGKLLVATDRQQLPELQALATRATARGLSGLRWLDAAEARALEPNLICQAALWCPDTGIVDSHGLMRALQADLQAAGGLLVCGTRVIAGQVLGGSRPALALHMADGSGLWASVVVNCAGLGAQALACRIAGAPLADIPRLHLAKGHYFSLAGRSPFSRLIYPLPEPGGLGVHLTLDLAGRARFGPDVQWVDTPSDLAVDPNRRPDFEQAIRRYWPGLPDGALQPDYAGLRPKLSGPGEPARDFVIQGPADHGVAGLVHLFGIESPGLTSALALAEVVAQLPGL
ncbi:MAG: NAD(P)/FAD-dependent oxidoreductase [Rhodoferax sp.]|nr:NAD(P)/FAD-dependent oxidoreductase [Rhodoferax sp.]